MLALAVVTVPQFAFAQEFTPDPEPRASSEAGMAKCSTLARDGLNGVVTCVISIFNIAIYLMIAGAVVYIMYGAFTMISNEEKREEAKKTIYYGIIGLFVMTSIWGLVNILDNTFKLSSSGNSTTVLNKSFIK